MIKVLIADDDTMIREGLKMIIESQEDMELVAVAVNGEEAVSLAREFAPDVAMLDIRMPIMDGLKACEVILKEKLALPLLLTTFDEEEFVLQAIQLGVSGYILKNSTSERILSAIHSVSVGATVFQFDILEYIQKNISAPHKKDDIFLELSERELDVVKLIAQGLSNHEIAEKLFLTNGTVRNYISSSLEKAELAHRTQLAVAWLTKGD